MEKKIELAHDSSLKCDNTNCNYRDESVDYSKLSDYINKPCPKCGENLLTYEDYKNAEILMKTADIINDLSDEEMKAIQSIFKTDIKELKESPMFKDAEGLELLDGDPSDTVTMRFETHKEIKVSKISKETPPTQAEAKE